MTSDSIAAWVAGQAGASILVLVKPPGATGALVDPYFARALPAGVTCEIVAADDVATRFERALAGSGVEGGLSDRPAVGRVSRPTVYVPAYPPHPP